MEALLILALLVLVYFLAGFLWPHVFRVDFEPDEIHFARTHDGVRLAMHRFRPTRKAERKLPVVLCHGLGANRFNWACGNHPSLLDHLRARGYDLWVLELRGIGMSSRPIPKGRVQPQWNFDDLVLSDVPAAIDCVLRATGAEAVHWIGHSMGGMVMYAFLQGEGAHRVQSLVAIGSPGDFKAYRTPPWIVKAARWRASTTRTLRQRLFARPFAPFVGSIPLPFRRILFQPDNMDPAVLRRAMAHLLDDVPGPLFVQFIDSIEKHELHNADGTVSYRAGLGRITTPILFIAGGADYLSPPAAVKGVWEAVSSKDKLFVTFGRKYGAKVDYGHGDLVLGRMAPVEVFPAVSEWLDRH